MQSRHDKRNKRIRRHARVRAKVKGTGERPRLSVFRSNKHVWVQLIDDEAGKTLASAGGVELLKKGKKAAKGEKARLVGETLAKKALDINISRVVFDRGGYKYHGIVKAVAEGARKGGLKF